MDHEDVVEDNVEPEPTDTDDMQEPTVGGKNRRNKSAKKRNGSRKGGRKSQKQKGGKKHKKTAKKGTKKKGTKKKGAKKAPSKWIAHVKNFAKSRNINYGAAMKHPDCKGTYKPV
jgi:hypothetical protein